MTENVHLIWFVAMALATIVILTVGTLAAAGMLGRQQDEEAEDEPGPDRETVGAQHLG